MELFLDFPILHGAQCGDFITEGILYIYSSTHYGCAMNITTAGQI
jgi:hypothetical protein